MIFAVIYLHWTATPYNYGPVIWGGTGERWDLLRELLRVEAASGPPPHPGGCP